MEKGRRDTVLLTVIAIATLLVAIVGATFAYFTANLNGNNRTSTITIKSSSGATVKYYSNSIIISSENIYPRDNYAWASKPFRLDYTNANATYAYDYELILHVNNQFASDEIQYSLERATGYCQNNTDIDRGTCESSANGHTASTWVTTDVETEGTGEIAIIPASSTTYFNNGSENITLGGAGAKGTFAANTTRKIHAYVLKVYYPNKETNQNTQQGKKLSLYIEAKEVENRTTTA